MRQEEMDVLRAAYALANALCRLNKKPASHEAKMAFDSTRAALVMAAFGLQAVPAKERITETST